MQLIKPKPHDFSKYDLEYFSVYGIEKLSGILAIFQLQDDEFLNKKEYLQKIDERKTKIFNNINNLVLAGELECIISEEKREACDDPDGLDIYEWTENVQCIRLSEFAAWVKKQNNFKCPQEILDKAPIESGHKKNITDNQKTVDGLLKMVIAMAIDGYGYDPQCAKSSITTEIMNALDRCGLTLSENTIRTRLKEAQLHLPRDHEKQKKQ